MQAGLYALDKVSINIGNITFHHETAVPEAGTFELLQNGDGPLGPSTNSQKPRI